MANITLEPNERFPIEEYMMTDNDCYKSTKTLQKPLGIQVHSVGSKGTTRERWRRWNKSGMKKCAGAFIDTNGIMQCLPWDKRPWLSGSGKNGNANNFCVGFEICEPKTDTKENAEYLYSCVKYLCVQLCKALDINPADIKTHCELNRMGYASNHADVNHWWGKKGTPWEDYTMDRLRKEVSEEIGVELMETIRKGSSGDDVKTLQEYLLTLGYYKGKIDGEAGSGTIAAVKEFQRAEGLKVDGICGKNTWAKFDEIFGTITEEEPDPDAMDDGPKEDTVTITLNVAFARGLYDALKEVL